MKKSLYAFYPWFLCWLRLCSYAFSSKKTFFRTAILSVTSLCAQAQSLPVLRVSFAGKELTNEYQRGRMQLTDTDGSVIQLNAKFKTRGATASNYTMKPAFNMKLRNEDFSEEQDTLLLGIRSASSWILDAMAIDRICMRNRVCFDVWNDFSKLPYATNFNGRNGTVGKFVEVYINDEYYGIYCLTDRINRKLLNLKKVKLAEDGTQTLRGALYKHGTNDIEDQTIPGFFNDHTVYVAQIRDAWELTYPEKHASGEAWKSLIKSYQDDRYDYVKNHFHIDNLADYTILIMAFSIGDNWGNKNHFYSVKNMQKLGEDDSRLVITPWDMDSSLGGDHQGTYYGGNFDIDWMPLDMVKNSRQPFTECLSQQSFQQLLRSKWRVARKGAFSVESVKKRLYAYRDLFEKSGAWKRQWEHFQTKKHQPCMVENITEEVEHIVGWYKRRVQILDEYFDTSVGVSPIKTDETKTSLYDLQGRKVSDGTQKGVYLRNGRKIIIGR